MVVVSFCVFDLLACSKIVVEVVFVMRLFMGLKIAKMPKTRDINFATFGTKLAVLIWQFVYML